MTRSIARLAAAALALAPRVAVAWTPTPSGPSFDCAQARGRDERLVCETPELVALDRRVAEAYAAALKRVPRKEAAKVRATQLEWLHERAGCATPRDGAAPAREEAIACVRLASARRLTELADRGASPPAPLERRSIVWSDERGHVEVDIAYPALPGAARGARAFTAWSERQARAYEARAREIAADPDVAETARGGGMPSAVAVTFAVPLATPHLVSVVFRGWEYASGGAHGLPFQATTVFDLERARPLGAADLFIAGGLAAAADRVVAKLRGYGLGVGEEEGVDPASAAKVAGALANWTFRPDAVEVTFPVYTVAPYATGPIPVWLTYEELRPFLRPDAPVPPR